MHTTAVFVFYYCEVLHKQIFWQFPTEQQKIGQKKMEVDCRLCFETENF